MFLACRPLSPGVTKRCRSTPYFFATLCNIFCGSTEGRTRRNEVISRRCLCKPFTRSRIFCTSASSPKTCRRVHQLPLALDVIKEKQEHHFQDHLLPHRLIAVAPVAVHPRLA